MWRCGITRKSFSRVGFVGEVDGRVWDGMGSDGIVVGRFCGDGDWIGEEKSRKTRSTCTSGILSLGNEMKL